MAYAKRLRLQRLRNLLDPSQDQRRYRLGRDMDPAHEA